MEENTEFVARLTGCRCGHAAIEHYDSHDFCTWSLDGDCECERFEAAEDERWITLTTRNGLKVTTGDAE